MSDDMRGVFDFKHGIVCQRPKWLRRWFGLRCLMQWCGGMVDHDGKSVYWQCVDCGKKKR